jgi:hypothetical protein
MKRIVQKRHEICLTWDFAGNIIAQEKLLKAFIGVVRCFPSP